VEQRRRGWFAWTGRQDLTNEQRQVIEQRIDASGRLLGVVQVEVYENDCLPYFTFPEGAVLGVDADPTTIADMVARARTEREGWR
jgi:hypothetical protein